jgi:hypothetical protein
MQQEIKDKIINLLRTEKQTTGKLVDKNKRGECSFCIEGIFGLVMGAAIVNNPDTEDSAKYCLELNGHTEPFSLDCDEFYKHNIPPFLNADLVKEVLSEDTHLISKCEGLENLSWIGLNDDYGVTFSQFEKIIEAL